MIGRCEWREETLIDFVLGNLSDGQTDQLRLHLADCQSCQEKVNHWKERLEKNEAIQPSPFLKTRIDNTIRTLSRKKRKRFSLNAAFIIASACAILLSVIGLYQIKPVQHEPSVVLQNDEIKENTVIDAPETNRFYIQPVSHFDQIEGYAWVNDATKEMLLKVDGLRPYTKKDYQIWLVHSDHHLYDDVLHVEDGRVKLYYKGSDVNYVTLIRVSLEPKGGSETPTGPEPFIVELNR